MITKDYKQTFDIEIGEHKQEAIVVTPPYQKRCNIDEVGVSTHITTINGVEYLGSRHIVIDEAEDGSHIEIRLDRELVEAMIPTEVPTEDIGVDATSSATTITFLVPGEMHISGKHMNLMFEVEGTGVHYGGNVIVHPADESQCFSAGRLLVNGSFKDFSATIDEDGQVSIVIYDVQLASTDTVKVHYQVLLREE